MNELNELFGALAKAQMEMTVAEKNSTNPHFRSDYADLASNIYGARPYLTKHGLCVLQPIRQEGDKLYLYSILGHSSGQFLDSKIEIKPTDTKIQSLGSYLTYLRRYAYASLINLAPGVADTDMTDDDGEEDRKLFEKQKAERQKSYEQNKKPVAAPAAVVPLINDDELKSLYDKLKEIARMQAEEGHDGSLNDESMIQLIADELLKETLVKGKIKSLSELEASRFKGIMNWLDGK